MAMMREQKNKIIEEAARIVAPVLEEQAMELVDVELRTEGRDLVLTLFIDNQSNGDRLNASGGQLRSNLAPQQRRDFVAVKAVYDSARFLSVNQVVVDLARVLQRGENGVFGNFMEYQTLYRNLRLENFAKMPADSFSLSIFISCQIELCRPVDKLLELLDLFRLVRRNNVNRVKVFVDVDAQMRPRF